MKKGDHAKWVKRVNLFIRDNNIAINQLEWELGKPGFGSAPSILTKLEGLAHDIRIFTEKEWGE